jgi:hypothetical protein
VLTLALYGLLAVVVIGVLYLVAARLLPAGEQIAPPVRDEPLWALPSERPLVAADVAEVRLPVALRGYRFAETDLLLDRLVDELRARDEEIARLGGRPPAQRFGEPTAQPKAPPAVTPAAPDASSVPPAKPAASTPAPKGADVSSEAAEPPAEAAGAAADEPDGHAG